MLENMAEYRTHMKIIGDILSTTRDDLLDDDGASVTFLIRKANVSHSRISRILKTLVSQGLMEQVNANGSCRYRISQSGREFLQAYYTFTRFADNFGLTI
jgi:predicted transcriptional regulator